MGAYDPKGRAEDDGDDASSRQLVEDEDNFDPPDCPAWFEGWL